jgi:hypothetical protein
VPLQPTTSDAVAEVVAHGSAFRNTVERPPGSGNFVLPLGKKLLYAWPGLGYTAMRFLRGTQVSGRRQQRRWTRCAVPLQMTVAADGRESHVAFTP